MSFKSIIKKLFPPTICDSCGKEINGIEHIIWHEVHCTDKILGYDLYDEKFAPSSRVYFFNRNYKKKKVGQI